MTKDELWSWAVNFAVSKDGWQEKAIMRLLDMAGGDVSAALGLMTKVHWYEGWKGEFYPADDSIAARLGTSGVCGPSIPKVYLFGSAASHPIEAWYPETDFVNNGPDLLIPWREVFEFIKAGRKRTVQLQMF